MQYWRELSPLSTPVLSLLNSKSRMHHQGPHPMIKDASHQWFQDENILVLLLSNLYIGCLCINQILQASFTQVDRSLAYKTFLVIFIQHFYFTTLNSTYVTLCLQKQTTSSMTYFVVLFLMQSIKSWSMLYLFPLQWFLPLELNHVYVLC